MMKFELYSPEEIELADSYIKHSRDENIAYVGMEQFLANLVQNRATGIVYETPQIAYMMIALTLSRLIPQEERMRWVKDFTMQQVILTLVCHVIMAGLCDPQRQFQKCLSGNR